MPSWFAYRTLQNNQQYSRHIPKISPSLNYRRRRAKKESHKSILKARIYKAWHILNFVTFRKQFSVSFSIFSTLSDNSQFSVDICAHKSRINCYFVYKIKQMLFARSWHKFGGMEPDEKSISMLENYFSLVWNWTIHNLLERITI